jgi:ATP-dependent Zn protease
VFWGTLILVAALIWIVAQQKKPVAKATYSRFVERVDAGNVKDAVISVSTGGANPVSYTLRDGTSAQTVLPADYRKMLEHMQQKMVNIEIRDAGSQWFRAVASAVPFLVLLAFWFGMMSKLRNWPVGRGAE